MIEITQKDKEHIKELYFNRLYSIDEISDKYKKKYERPQIRGYLYRIIDQE